jgi:hypothetical protein
MATTLMRVRFPRSRSTGLKAQSARITSRPELHQHFLDPIGSGARLADSLKSALLQNADGADIGDGDVRVERPRRFVVAHELCHCRRCDALAPVCLSEPIAEEALVVVLPTHDAACNLAVEEDGLFLPAVVADHVAAPVRDERIPLAGREGRHLVRFRLALVFEEDRQLSFVYVAEGCP